jgi:hypothetical protein
LVTVPVSQITSIGDELLPLEDVVSIERYLPRLIRHCLNIRINFLKMKIISGPYFSSMRPSVSHDLRLRS